MFIGLANCDLGEDEELMGSDYLKTMDANPKKRERRFSLKFKKHSIHSPPDSTSFVGRVISAVPTTPPIFETAPPTSETALRTLTP